MRWNRQFISQDYGRPTKQLSNLPVYETDEFDFYRCVEFKNEFYGKNASELFNGNLRMSSGRYASLFPNQRISYWANSPETARAEIKKHGAGCSLLTFWAYDDRSSTFPTVSNQQKLRIIDGRKCGIQELIDKVESKEPLSDSEKVFMQRIINTAPDCIAYDSHAKTGGENFLFFEQGFKKLSLRELNLRLSKEQGANHCSIVCAIHCDYSPFIDRYGLMILPKARVCMDEKYLLTEEYKKRKEIYDESCRRFRPLIIL